MKLMKKFILMRYVLYRRYFNEYAKIFNIKFIHRFYSNKSIIRYSDIKKFGVLGKYYANQV